MAWTTLNWSTGNILTSAEMTQMQANFAAIANGDSGAPLVVAAAIQDGSIKGAKIDPTELSSSSYSIPASTRWVPTFGWAEVTCYYDNDAYIRVTIFSGSGWRLSGTVTPIGLMVFNGSSIGVQNNHGSVAKRIDYRAVTS